MDDPSERRGTTRVEKRKTVAVGNGGTIIEVRAYVRGTRLDATGPYGNECVGMNEWKSTDTDGARENLKLKPNRIGTELRRRG